MTHRRLILAGIFLSAFILAFFLNDVVERAIIVPLAYLWWLLGLYYSILPQFVLWILLVVIVIISAVTAFTPRFTSRRVFVSESKSSKGQIENLVEWLDKSRHGSYYKWLVANRLGKTAREILAQREGQPISRKFRRLEGRDWNPSQAVHDYLESGLNGSFADFPRPRLPWQTPNPTPLDADPKGVVEYLENEMKVGK